MVCRFLIRRKATNHFNMDTVGPLRNFYFSPGSDIEGGKCDWGPAQKISFLGDNSTEVFLPNNLVLWHSTPFQ